MIDESIGTVDLADVKQDIYHGIAECNKRGLIHSVKWLAELNYGLTKTEGTTASSSKFPSNPNEGIAENEYDQYCLAKSYFDCREYDRSAYFTQNCESPVPQFLHFYAIYMAKEKRRLENLTDAVNFNQSGNCKDLNDLLGTLKVLYAQRNMDAYLLYLMGVVYKKVELNNLAIPIFIESIHLEPTLWSSWIELAPLITDSAKLMSLNFPSHWMKPIFMARTLVQLSLNDEGFKMFEDLQAAGFKDCVFITSQMAIANHNKRSIFYFLPSNSRFLNFS